MLIDKAGKFTLKVAKNIAAMKTEEERSNALLAVKPESRSLVEATMKAILSGTKRGTA